MKLTFVIPIVFAAVFINVADSRVPFLTELGMVENLTQCRNKLTDNTKFLWGSLLDEQVVSNLSSQAFYMYYDKHMKISEILDYFIDNYRNIGLQASQIDTISDVANKLSSIVDGSDQTRAVFNKIKADLMQFVDSNQSQIDTVVRNLQASGANEAQIAFGVCEKMLDIMSVDKLMNLKQKLIAELPIDVKQAVLSQASRLFDVNTLLQSLSALPSALL